ncbi:hypothetical protein BKA63DRAFT_569512 [Paraphoma chrysanthemicola]|nr:hypothetical protein BKA63DRAFT_569512 [Paraphoma chrysanthemicola]
MIAALCATLASAFFFCCGRRKAPPSEASPLLGRSPLPSPTQPNFVAARPSSLLDDFVDEERELLNRDDSALAPAGPLTTRSSPTIDVLPRFAYSVTTILLSHLTTICGQGLAGKARATPRAPSGPGNVASSPKYLPLHQRDLALSRIPCLDFITNTVVPSTTSAPMHTLCGAGDSSEGSFGCCVMRHDLPCSSCSFGKIAPSGVATSPMLSLPALSDIEASRTLTFSVWPVVQNSLCPCERSRRIILSITIHFDFARWGLGAAAELFNPWRSECRVRGEELFFSLPAPDSGCFGERIWIFMTLTFNMTALLHLFVDPQPDLSDDPSKLALSWARFGFKPDSRESFHSFSWDVESDPHLHVVSPGVFSLLEMQTRAVLHQAYRRRLTEVCASARKSMKVGVAKSDSLLLVAPLWKLLFGDANESSSTNTFAIEDETTSTAATPSYLRLPTPDSRIACAITIHTESARHTRSQLHRASVEDNCTMRVGIQATITRQWLIIS